MSIILTNYLCRTKTVKYWFIVQRSRTELHTDVFGVIFGWRGDSTHFKKGWLHARRPKNGQRGSRITPLKRTTTANY